MTYLNTYQAPKPAQLPTNVHLDTSPEGYDFNFCFDPRLLATDRLELRPFVPSLHAKLLWDEFSNSDRSLFRFLIDYKDFNDFLAWLENTIRAQPSALGHAIFTAPPGKDTPTDPKDFQIAGFASLINTDPVMMVSEPGWLVVLEKYHRTHVLTHTAGLLIHRILDMPSEGGLGLRRCQWFTNNLHVKSQAAAARLGFKIDGVIKSHRVLVKGKEGGLPGRKGDYREECDSRDSFLARITWDEWEGGVRDHVDKLMARRV